MAFKRCRFFVPYNSPLLEGCPQDGVFYVSWPAENFCIKVSVKAGTMYPQKFVRPDLM